jgi:hypothetical protein
MYLLTSVADGMLSRIRVFSIPDSIFSIPDPGSASKDLKGLSHEIDFKNFAGSSDTKLIG